MFRLLAVIGIFLSVPITLMVLLQGVARIWDLWGQIPFLIACASVAISFLSVALLFDSRHPPQPRSRE